MGVRTSKFDPPLPLGGGGERGGGEVSACAGIVLPHPPTSPNLSALKGGEGPIESCAGVEETDDLLPDPSFERLLGALAWRRLPETVRERFRWKPAPGAEIRYRGIMEEVRCSTLGWWLARLFRVIGTPLAPHTGRNVPVTVTLRLDRDGEGIVWERRYAFAGRRPVTCRSVKRATDQGLTEYVGGGISMWLRLSVRDRALLFESTGYFWRLGPFALRLPAWLTPGALLVAHIDEGEGRFRFRITVTHPLWGETFHQDGVFARPRS